MSKITKRATLLSLLAVAGLPSAFGAVAAAGAATPRSTAAAPGSQANVMAARLHLVATSSRREAQLVQRRFGLRALWLFDPSTGHFRSLANVAGPVATTIYATTAHVNAVLAAPRAAAPVTAAAASPLELAPTAIGAPVGYSRADLAFSDSPGVTVLGTDWNRYITSRAAGGWPWNTNSAGGSSSANPSVDLDGEYYEPSNVTTHRGVLDLRAVHGTTSGMLGNSAHSYPFSSGALSTYGKFEFTGGYVQVEAKMPSGDGMWPGIWMLPGPGGSAGDNYEIDLFEGGMNDAGPGSSPATTFAWHIHAGDRVVGEDSNVGTNLTTSFHTYGLSWVPGQSLTWYLDGRKVGALTSAQVSIPDEPMELILTLQVALAQDGGWHTVPDSSTPRVSNMLVSGVQIYRLP